MFSFGSPAAPAFGAASTPTFGASASATPAFGAATTAPAFGAAQSAFGAASTAAPALGATSAPAFGAAPSPAGASSTPAFGATTTSAFGTSTPAFGAAPAASAPAFGAAGSSLFGAASTPAFGAASTPSLFGAPAQSTGASLLGTSLGAPAFGATQPGAAFGAAPATSGLFGAAAPSAPPSNLMTRSTPPTPVSYATQWGDISEAGQTDLLNLERNIAQVRAQAADLTLPPLPAPGSDPAADDAKQLRHVLQLVSASVTADDGALGDLRPRVMHILRQTEHAVRLFQRNQAWRAPDRSKERVTVTLTRGEMAAPVELPSRVLLDAATAFATILADCTRLCSDLARVLPVDGGDNAHPSGGDLSAMLGATLRNAQAGLMHVAAKAQAVHAAVDAARAQHLAALGTAGGTSDPFEAADEAERAAAAAAKKQCASRLATPSKAPEAATTGASTAAASGTAPGAAPSPTPSLFGAPAATTPGTTPNLFGAAAAPSTPSIFGTPTASAGAPSPAPSLFGAPISSGGFGAASATPADSQGRKWTAARRKR